MHKYSLQTTIELKTPLQILFWKCSERKDCSKSLKFQKTLGKTIPFPLKLQACNAQFLTLPKTDSKKNVSFECSEIVGSLPGKGLQWSHLIKLIELLLETKRF